MKNDSVDNSTTSFSNSKSNNKKVFSIEFGDGFEKKDEQKGYFLLSDEPINGLENELSFEFKKIGDGLTNIAKEAMLPCSMGIYGSWGRGKTTLLYYIMNKLKSENEYTFFFSPWKFDSSVDISLNFVKQFIKNYIIQSDNKKTKIKKSNIRKVGGLLLKSVAKSIINQIPMSNLANDLLDNTKNAIVKIRKEINENTEFYNEEDLFDEIKSSYRKTVKEIIDEWNYQKNTKCSRIYIFIDDLDRCHPSTVMKFFDKLKNFFNSDNVVYIIGIYPEVINSMIREKYKSEEYNYTNKFFQFTYTLPALSQKQLKKYIESIKKQEIKDETGKPSSIKQIDINNEEIILISYLCKTPRQIKLLINSTIGVFNIHPTDKGKFITYIFLTFLMKEYPDIPRTIVQSPNPRKFYESFMYFKDVKSLVEIDSISQSTSGFKTAIKKFFTMTTQINSLNIGNKNFSMKEKISIIKNNERKEIISVYNKLFFNNVVLDWLSNEKINYFLIYFFATEKRLSYEEFESFFENINK